MRVVFILVLCSTLFADSWDGAEYAKNSSVQRSNAEKVLSHLSLRGDEHILNVGCGTGEVTAELAALIPDGKVIGLDPSVSMLAIAREHAKLPNLQFIEGRA